MRVSALHALVLTVFLAFSGPYFKRSDIRRVGVGFVVQKASMFHWVSLPQPGSTDLTILETCI